MNYARLLVGLLLLHAPVALAAQQPLPALPLKRALPAVAWSGCPESERPAAASSAQREEGERLAEAATQAALLGDKAAVLDLLTKAYAADSTSADIAFRLARALDENRSADALATYCRYLLLAPNTTDAAEVRERTRVLGTPPGFAVPAEAARAFEAGIYQRDGGKLAEAEASFTKASEVARNWGDPVYNRAAVRLEQGQTDPAVEDLRRFLELSPGSPDFNSVVDMIARLRQTEPPQNPNSVLMRGLLIPGLGQFTTGRAGRGVLYLGVTAAAAAVGFSVTRVSVDCLIPPVDGQCPPGQVASEKENRPYLVPALAVAAASWVFGAVDAYRAVNRQRTELVRPSGQSQPQSGLTIQPPALAVGLGTAQLDLIRLRF